jgi:hypothetical protein
VKDELLQIRDVFEKRMLSLEQKIDSGQRNLESRVAEIEMRLHIQNSSPSSTEPSEQRRNEKEHELSVVMEDSEEYEEEDEVDSGNTNSSEKLPNSGKGLKSRSHTDSDVIQMAQQRRQKYTERKSKSLHDSQELQPKPCDQNVILWLNQRVINWKFIARWLGLSESEVSRIETDHQGDREQCFKMFMRWKETDPGNYTYLVLGEALKKESQELFNEYVKEVHRVENNISVSK